MVVRRLTRLEVIEEKIQDIVKYCKDNPTKVATSAVVGVATYFLLNRNNAFESTVLSVIKGGVAISASYAVKVAQDLSDIIERRSIRELIAEHESIVGEYIDQQFMNIHDIVAPPRVNEVRRGDGTYWRERVDAISVDLERGR